MSRPASAHHLTRGLVAVLALVAFVACSGAGDQPRVVRLAQVEPAPSAVGPLLGLAAGSDLPAGAFAEVDTDGDGITDRSSYTFPTAVVARGLSVDQTVAVQEEPHGRMLVIEYRYSGTGGTPVSGTHRVVIPKEVAADVSELSFDPAPARVVDPDPEVEVEVTLDPDAVAGFVVRTRDRLAEQSRQRRMAEVVLVVGREVCLEKPPPVQEGCLISVVRDVAGVLPRGGATEVCDELRTHGAYITCRAMTLQDRAACSDLVGRPHDHDACVGYVADSRCIHEPSAAGADRCRIALAVQWGASRACLFITDPDAKAACLAALAKDPGRCSGIGDPTLAGACADAIRAGRPVEDLFEPAPVPSASPEPGGGSSSGQGSSVGGSSEAGPDQSDGRSSTEEGGVAGEGLIPQLPVTLQGTVSGFPKSAVKLTLEASGATGSGSVDLTEGEVPGHATFTFRGTRESETTWSGTAHVVEDRGGSKDDPILGFQGDHREYDTGWQVTFGPDGITAGVEQWGPLDLQR